MSKSFLQEIDQLVRARYSLLYVVSWEEERVRRLLAQVTTHQSKWLFEWSITDGLRKVASPTQSGPQEATGSRAREVLQVLNEILQSNAEAVYLLKDFHQYVEAPEVVRQLRDLAQALRRTKKTVVLLAPTLKIPPELEKATTVVDLPLPGYEELEKLLDDSIGGSSSSRRFQINLTPPDKDALIKAAMGLTLSEAENAFAKAIVRDTVLDRDDLPAVVAEKMQTIRKTGLLEYYDVNDDLSNVGGMDLLKEWLGKRVRAFSDEARRYGLPQPRGILLMGVQGCGKSLIAKSVSAAWKLPLLRLDMSRIFQGYIGSSEENMRRALTIAESLAPVILWVDEIEKAFSGIEGSSGSDSGSTARVIGQYLTWMQEKKEPVFVVATANNVKSLPPELLRKGRLDEIFFVDLPRARERTEIFDIHLTKLRRDPKQFDIGAMVHEAQGFSGAEIEQAILSALHDSFFDNREVTTEDIVRSVQETVPLSQTMREKIEELRMWAADRARPVSSSQRGSDVEVP